MSEQQEQAQFLQVYRRLPKTSQATMDSIIRLAGSLLWQAQLEQGNKMHVAENGATS